MQPKRTDHSGKTFHLGAPSNNGAIIHMIDDITGARVKLNEWVSDCDNGLRFCHSAERATIKNPGGKGTITVHARVCAEWDCTSKQYFVCCISVGAHSNGVAYCRPIIRH